MSLSRLTAARGITPLLWQKRVTDPLGGQEGRRWTDLSAVKLTGAIQARVSGFWARENSDGTTCPVTEAPSRRTVRFVGSFACHWTAKEKSPATTQGSGWGVLAYEPVSGRLVVEQIYDHQDNVGQGSVPILVFDAWEHAFYLQYRNQKADFIEAMWRVVDWQDVAKRHAAAKDRAFNLLVAP